MESATSAGSASAAVRKNTERSEKCSPNTPISAAVRALPIDAQRALRPSRSPRSARETSAYEIAAMAGTSMQLAKPCSTSAANTGTNVGLAARKSALAMIATIADAAANFLLRIASTSAPAGSWLAIALIVPTESIRPISPCVHLLAARYEAMKGPKPVCTLATKKFSQSSARRLRAITIICDRYRCRYLEGRAPEAALPDATGPAATAPDETAAGDA